jgi:hypothetical protein
MRGKAQFDDLRWRDPLHGSRAHPSYGIWVLHLGLHAAYDDTIEASGSGDGHEGRLK